jgi:hypothetical protein
MHCLPDQSIVSEDGRSRPGTVLIALYPEGHKGSLCIKLKHRLELLPTLQLQTRLIVSLPVKPGWPLIATQEIATKSAVGHP